MLRKMSVAIGAGASLLSVSATGQTPLTELANPVDIDAHAIGGVGTSRVGPEASV
jgi:Spy/CpxP family protein refolding chaperone